MPPPFVNHPLREQLTAELHARPYRPLAAPERLSHIAYLSGERGSGRNYRHLADLLSRFGAKPPEPGTRHHFADLGLFRVRWERHTEFVTYTFFRRGPFLHPFADPPIELVPEDWIKTLPGQVIAAVTLAIEARDTPERTMAEIAALFEGNTVIGASAVGGAGRLWSDLRIHADGYSRVLLRDVDLSERQAGRLAQRVLEINAYRALALLALPLAREAGPHLLSADHKLTELAGRMAAEPKDGADPASDRQMLDELSALSAEIEELAAKTSYRFGAARAYYGLVCQRLDDLRQERIKGLQTLSEFLDGRLAPAIATCNSTETRQEDLARRAARLTSLLRARVEVALEEQNRGLLESMNRRARLQLRLQETVEGLSVVAITYYGVGLMGTMFKSLTEAGAPLDPVLATGLSVPVVAGLVWLGLRRLRRRLHRDEE